MMAKDQQEGTPGRDGTAASQVQTADAVLAEQDLCHDSQVVNGTIYEGSASSIRHLGHREDRGVRGISVHSTRATKVDGTSRVLNGSVTDGQEPSAFRIHSMDGGFVKNNSRLVNGDLTPDEFRRVFCNGR